ncbi:MAG: glycosyltransferase family 9 protein [Phycisphaerales bacterium]
MPPIDVHIQNLVIELPSWIGDTVMATPVLAHARACLPRARITGIMRPGLASLLEGCTDLDAMIEIDPRGLRGMRAMRNAVRGVRPDAVLLLRNSLRSAIIARLSGAALRVGYAGNGRSFLLTHVLDRKNADDAVVRSTVDDYAALTEFAFGCPIAEEHASPGLRVDEESRRAARELLGDTTGRYIVLNPGANRLDKRWPVDRFAAVADHFSKQGLSIVINGSPAELDLTSRACAAMTSTRSAVNLAEHSMILATLKAVIDGAALLITNDTGPRHIAIALRTPIVSLFGPTDHRWTIVPGANEQRLLAEPFLPDELVADRHAKTCTMDRIAVADVIAASERALSAQHA